MPRCDRLHGMKRTTRKNQPPAARTKPAPLTFLVVGAGGRGFVYADLAKKIPAATEVFFCQSAPKK